MSDLNWCICGKATSDNVFYCSHDCQVSDTIATSPPPSPPSAQAQFINTASQSIEYRYQDVFMHCNSLFSSGGRRSLANSMSTRSIKVTIPAPYHCTGKIPYKHAMETCDARLTQESRVYALLAFNSRTRRFQ